MATPDVRVRLSAEGVNEVVGALRKIQAEAGTGAKKASSAFGGLNSTLAGTRGLILQLGAAVGVGALVAMTRQASEAADQLGKMSQKVGASVENLSSLRLVAATADLSMEALTKTLTIFNRKVADLQEGSKDAVRDFGRLGLTAKDFAGKDAAERLDLVAQAFGKLKDGPDKAALAFGVFGKSAADVIPLLNDLSEGGLPAAAREAERLGVVLSEDTARAAQSVNDDFTRLQLQLQTGFARFVEGLAPQITSTMKSVQDVLGNNADAWKFWGELVGGIIKGVGFFLVSTFDAVITTIRQIGIIAGGVFSAIDKAIKRDFSGAANDVRAIFSIINKEERGFDERQKARNKAFTEAAKIPALRSGVQESEAGPREKAVDLDKLKRERERLELAKQRAREENARRLAAEAVTAIERQQLELEKSLAEVDAQVAAGNLTQREGFEATQALLVERRDILEQIIRVNLALVATNPFDVSAMATLQAANAELQKLNQSIAAQPDLWKNIRTTAKDALEQGITDGLTRAIAEGERFLDVLRNIAFAIVNAVQQLLAFEIAKRVVAAIPGFSGGGVVTKAAGGLISGPGSGTSDSIPARLSAGEYVVRAAIVGQPGILAHLEDLNQGRRVRSFSGARRFAEGGLVTAAGQGRSDVGVTLALAPGLVVSEISTPEGERAIVRVLAKNPRAAGRAMGAG
jgi:hypothetical protein